MAVGGSDIIDINNANIRVYTRLPGMYPNIAKKIVKGVPYSDINQLVTKAGLTDEEAKIVDKYLPNLVALEPAPEVNASYFSAAFCLDHPGRLLGCVLRR
jgi:photosystem II PsbU protein